MGVASGVGFGILLVIHAMVVEMAEGEEHGVDLAVVGMVVERGES